MPTDATGNYTLVSSYFVQNGDTVLPVQHNPPFEDVAQALTNRLMKDGRTVMTGDLKMGGNKVTNAAPGESDTDATTVLQLADKAASKAGFKTVSLMLADNNARIGYSGSGARVIVAAGDIIEAQGFRYEVADSAASDEHVTTAGGVKLYVRPLGDRMYFAAFGLVGGDTDETTLLQTAFAASAGYELRAGRAQTYRSTESLQLAEGTELNLRGSRINFACVGEKRNLEIYGDNVRVHKGAVSNVVGTEGFEGSFQTPITIARYQELGGFKGVVVEDMTIETVMPNGNGIAIFGDSDNIDIGRITFPDSSFIGRPIMAHWSFNSAEVNLGGDKITSHQKNLRIHDIWCGVLSDIPDSSLYFNTSVVFLSAVYNADVSNIYIENFSRGKAVTVYAGDWGFQYATDLEKALGSGGISVRNVWGRAFSGVEVYMKNPLDTISLWPVQVTFDNVNLNGYGLVNNASRGFILIGCDGVSIERSIFDGFDYGGYPSEDVTNFRFSDNKIRNSRRHGIAGTETTGSSNWEFRGNTLQGNNASNTASQADVFVRLVDIIGIDDNTFDSPLCDWNVRLDGGANAPSKAKLRGNHSFNVDPAAGPCFSIGNSSDTVATLYEGNTADVVPTNGIRGGQTVIGYLTSVASAPPYVGAQAVIPGGAAYIATGVASAADWKQITN